MLFFKGKKLCQIKISQIEGGWNEDGKGLSIWDVFSADPTNGNILNGDNGKIACDSYHKYKEDVQLLKNMSVNAYRFSISWPRILPNGIGEVNQLGINYYNNLINELLANGIAPAITLYHQDLPEALQEKGGWLNPDVPYWFAEYARLCFSKFGDRVKIWITLNEPLIQAHSGYGIGKNAPGIKGPGTLEYHAAHNLIKSHAKAYRVYQDEFVSSQDGIVGITLNMGWGEPAVYNDSSHVEASEIRAQFDMGWFANPIFINGKYPEIMRQKVRVLIF